MKTDEKIPRVRFNGEINIITLKEVDKFFTDEEFEKLFNSFDLNSENFDKFLNSHDLFHFLAGYFKIYISSSTEAKKNFIEFNLERLKIKPDEKLFKELQWGLESALSKMSEGKKQGFKEFAENFYESMFYRGLQYVRAEFEVQDARSGSAEGSQKDEPEGDKPEGDTPEGGVSNAVLDLNKARGGA